MALSTIFLIVFLFAFALSVFGLPYMGLIAAIAAVVTGILLIAKK